MLMQIVIMLPYADMGKWSYYAQNYASIVCQGLPIAVLMYLKNV